MSTPWKAMREATGLSQREIARRTDINSGRLSIIERGVEPSPEEAARLRRVLGELLTVADAVEAGRAAARAIRDKGEPA